MNDNRILIDDSLMLLRSKLKRLEFHMTAIDKALQSPEINMDRVTEIYNEFYSQADEVVEFINMLYDVVARILGYQVEEDTNA